MPIPPLPWEEIAEQTCSTPREGCAACRKRLHRASTQGAREGATIKVRCPRFCRNATHRSQIELHGRLGPGLAKKVRSQILNQAIPALCNDIEGTRQLNSPPWCAPKGREASRAVLRVHHVHLPESEFKDVFLE